MIEQALYQHLIAQGSLKPFLATYADKPAVFSQKAPSDRDPLWGNGPMYGRIVFEENLQGDPERTMGGMLAVDIMCEESSQFPEEIAPIVRGLIHGYFFSNGTFTVAAQFKDLSYFTQPPDHVTGCTLTFELLAFPIMTISNPDVISRLNEWTSGISGICVINHDELPSTAWKPTGDEVAVYWRVMRDASAGWIPDTFQTIWRMAAIKGHVFAESTEKASAVEMEIINKAYADKRLLAAGETPIIINRTNTIDTGADPLRTGQVTIEATYGVIVCYSNEESLRNIEY